MEHTVEKNYVQAVARAGSAFRAVAGVALALLVFAVLAGCGKGVNHKPVRDLVYVFGSGARVVYVLNADSLNAVDSICVFPPRRPRVEYMVVTPDGRWMFTSDEGDALGTLVRKIDIVAKRTVDSLFTSHRGALLLLDRGRLLHWGSCDGFLTEVDKFPVVTVDTTAVCVQHGPIAGTTIAGGVTGTNHIRVETVRPRATVAEFVTTKIDSVPVSDVYYVALHPDGKRVSALVRGGGYFFIVAEVATGRTIYQHALTSPAGWFFPGEIAINSAGTLAVVTDPGKPWFDYYIGTIDIVDLASLRLLKRIDQSNFGHPQSNAQIAFTTDEKSVIVSGGPLPGGFPDVHKVDLTSLTISRTIVMPDTASPGGMAVGPAPY
jgi:hypothetical protein